MSKDSGLDTAILLNYARCAASLSQTLQQVATSRQTHTLPDLPYDYDALEPHISAEIMHLHHCKHHAAYVNNLNVTQEKYLEALFKGDLTAQVALQPALKFNAGGHINHTIFWTNLSPNGGGEPEGELMEAIKRDFGSFQKMKEKMSAASVAVQGSGWGWLGFDKESRRLHIAACANQDPLQGTTGLVPLLGIDVWEHAYYLQYKSLRPDYVKAIWNVINWENVSERFQNGGSAPSHMSMEARGGALSLEEEEELMNRRQPLKVFPKTRIYSDSNEPIYGMCELVEIDKPTTWRWKVKKTP